jgi:predicted CXXCH cytochrome family protein
MKKTILVVALAIVLTFVFATSAFATTGKFFAGGVNYYKWLRTTGNPSPGTAFVNDGLSTIGANAANPGVHANYLANTAKCGICHSVHRAAGNGSMLLPQADTSCAGCHTAGTAVTTKIITWTPAPVDWVPVAAGPLAPVGSTAWMAASPADRLAATINTTESGGAFARDHDNGALQPVGGTSATRAASSVFSAGGPHNDSLSDMIGDGFWDGTGTPPLPTYEGFRYGCATRRCHSASPHGAGSSKYKIFAAKLLFNESANEDEKGDGTYGGLDAVYDELGATDAAVERFISTNEEVIRESPTSPGDLEIKKEGAAVWTAPDVAETHTLVSGLTCGRPSNPSTGEDECHAEASYAIFNKEVKENRNKATGISGNDGSLPAYPNTTQDPINGSNNFFRTDNTGGEAAGYGGNDSRTSKTGHVAGTFAAAAGEGSYAPIAGCTSCHDQTDSANTVVGNFTFPHGQTPTGNTNLKMAVGASADGTTGTGHRARIWSGWSGDVLADKTVTFSTPTGQKAFDGQCLKCHRNGAGAGIGLTK